MNANNQDESHLQPPAFDALEASLRAITHGAFDAWKKFKPDEGPAEFLADLVERVPTEDPNELSRQLAKLTCTMPMMSVANALFQLAKDHGLTDHALVPIAEVFAYYGIEDCFELVRANFVSLDIETAAAGDGARDWLAEDELDSLKTLPALAPDGSEEVIVCQDNVFRADGSVGMCVLPEGHEGDHSDVDTTAGWERPTQPTQPSGADDDELDTQTGWGVPYEDQDDGEPPDGEGAHIDDMT